MEPQTVSSTLRLAWEEASAVTIRMTAAQLARVGAFVVEKAMEAKQREHLMNFGASLTEQYGSHCLVAGRGPRSRKPPRWRRLAVVGGSGSDYSCRSFPSDGCRNRSRPPRTAHAAPSGVNSTLAPEINSASSIFRRRQLPASVARRFDPEPRFVHARLRARLWPKDRARQSNRPSRQDLALDLRT